MSELGDFLRSRREALSPEAVGLRRGARRRTPGLRRGELATLAGVSVEYLARLEQGRDRHPSAQVIGALADALRLSPTDLLTLRRIAKAQDGVPCLIIEPPTTTVRPTVQMVLDRLEPSPAVVLNRLCDVLAHTEGFARLMGPFGLLDAPRPNLVRFVFTDPRAREAYPDWSAAADARVGDLQLGLNGSDPYVTALTDELAITPRAGRPTGTETLRHPDAGELRLRPETMTFPDADDQRLIVYLPDDEPTSTGLDRLLRTGPRAVNTISSRAVAPTPSRVAIQRTTSP